MKLPRKSILPGPSPKPAGKPAGKAPLTDAQKAIRDQMQREKDESAPRPPFPPQRPD